VLSPLISLQWISARSPTAAALRRLGRFRTGTEEGRVPKEDVEDVGGTVVIYARRDSDVGKGEHMRFGRFGASLLVGAVLVCLSVAPAGADSTYHTGHIDLAPVASAPLSSGFVQNIHANGPNVYAHEIYQLNGAEPSSSYQVVLSIWTANISCSGESALQLSTAVVSTNVAGNGLADIVFTPADADGLRGLTVSAMWTLWNGPAATYATDCEILSLD
jgi:hypothetical protein